jgi:hypothetical protein
VRRLDAAFFFGVRRCTAAFLFLDLKTQVGNLKTEKQKRRYSSGGTAPHSKKDAIENSPEN